MVAFFKVSSISGAYIAQGDAPEDMLDIQAQPGEEVILGHLDPTLEYVDVSDPARPIVPKPAMGATLASPSTLPADGMTLAIITAIPAGTTVTVTGPASAQDVVDDGEYAVTFDHPGDYTIRLTHPLHLPQEFVIHAA